MSLQLAHRSAIEKLLGESCLQGLQGITDAGQQTAYSIGWDHAIQAVLRLIDSPDVVLTRSIIERVRVDFADNGVVDYE